MSYSLSYAGSFKKDYKRLEKRGLPLEKLAEAIKIFTDSGSLPSECRLTNFREDMRIRGSVA